MKRTLLPSLVCLFLAIASLATVAQARTIYVDRRTGNNEWTGATETPADNDGPLKSPSIAVKLAKPGDIIHVVSGSGPYYGVIRPKQSGEPDKPITIDGNDNEFNLYPDDPQTLWSKLGNGAWLYGQMYRDDADSAKLAGKTLGHYKGRRLIYTDKTDSPPLFSVTVHKDGRPIIHLPPEVRPPFHGLILNNVPTSSLVRITNVSHWHFKNMHVRGAGNDGFNWHGKGTGHVVENCTAMFCGDEGTSAHAEMEVTIRNSIFAFNGSSTGGVVDINQSKTSYVNCISAFNRDVGFRMREGGKHSLVDCLSAANERLEGPEELQEGSTVENFTQLP
ncbi:MAG: right-handed parallel beta-helix repeat-containing protein, partial [Kiritimatiellae bacterium]|nr:right-handed parallel beta-helix repeat-containing protein [Kiritimatiellia bacterium]